MKTWREKVKVKYTPAYQTYHSAGDEAEPYCPKCDADLSYDEYTFCPWCGSELDWEPKPKSEKVIVDEFPFDTERKCPLCYGDGYAYRLLGHYKDPNPEKEKVICGYCHGSGKEPEDK